MKTIKTILALNLVWLGGMAVAQPRHFDPKEMIQRQKTNVTENIEGLSDDQKSVIEEIYQEHTEKVSALLENRGPADRDPADREATREEMMALRKEKDALMKDLLTEEQYKKYKELVTRKRGGRRAHE